MDHGLSVRLSAALACLGVALLAIGCESRPRSTVARKRLPNDEIVIVYSDTFSLFLEPTGRKITVRLAEGPVECEVSNRVAENWATIQAIACSSCFR